ncbi:MAG: PaaI family thioesterase [Alphaproteobacteria bacterium]|nr:MAG: PaaI family thioesterase [Alphaproteobacteria bacterium]
MSDGVIEPPYPFQRLVGFEMIEWSAERALLRLELRPEHGNRYGIPHGGLHATLLDTAMGYAGCWTGDAARRQHAMTLALNVIYLARPEGRVLLAEGRRIGGGRRTFFAEGEVRDELGTRVARGTGTFRYRQGG